MRKVPFLFLLFLPLFCSAAQWDVTTSQELHNALLRAAAGDEIVMSPGTYEGTFSISTKLSLRGSKDTVIDAGGMGSCLEIRASGVRVSDLTLKNYGVDLYERNSGVLINEGSKDIVLNGLKIVGTGFGIRADKSEKILIEGCEIRGNKRKHVLDRGDGVYFNYVKEAVLQNNKVLYTRDGFYFENTDRTQSSGNYFAALQYGIHYMYTRGDSAWNNEAEACIGGYALMSSEKIRLFDNLSKRTVEFGVLLNETDASEVSNNRIERVKNPRGKPSLDTEGKGIFIYGGGINIVEGNSFEACEIGAGVAMGGEGTVLHNNRFIGNRLQVRYIGSSSVEWSRDGVGNFWSNYQGWDLNQDGVGDVPYQPNDSLDRLFWLYPQSRFLMDSPLVVLLRFITAQFQLDRAKGIVDSHPIMHDPVSTKKGTI